MRNDMEYLLSFLTFLLNLSICITSFVAWNKGWKVKVLMVCGLGAFIQFLTWSLNLLFYGMKSSPVVLIINSMVWIGILTILVLLSKYQKDSEDVNNIQILKYIKELK